jgi:hypothetical protein
LNQFLQHQYFQSDQWLQQHQSNQPHLLNQFLQRLYFQSDLSNQLYLLSQRHLLNRQDLLNL